jgi:hypothetical protein
MSIEETYRELITEQIVKDLLKEGTSPSVSAITTEFNNFIEDYTLSEPLFIANDFHVEYGESSSATKFNNANNAIQRDLKVLYKHLFKVSDQAINQFSRWRAQAQVLEGRLDNLVDRINSLLLISHDTAGYFNFIQDNFANNDKVDLANTTAYVNVSKSVACIGTSTSGTTRIDLSNLTDREVTFTILSRNNLVSSLSSQGSHTRYAITDVNNYWQEKVFTNKPGPVSAELKINFLEKKRFSRIDIDLHTSNQNSAIQLTPMYSSDNYSWQQLPVASFTRSVIDKTTFQFTSIEAQYIKFIMTKPGYDQVHNRLYSYEFGMDEIVFYYEGFAANNSSTLISKPLSVLDTSNQPEEFSKVVLEVCEDVPENTSINYFITVSNNPSVALSGFTAIDPLNRTSPTQPTVLDFGDLSAITVSDVGISYDPSLTSIGEINPSITYTTITSLSSTIPDEVVTVASDIRYYFSNSNDRILDHQIYIDPDAIQIAQGTLEVWRNVNTQGSETKVRGYANGWGFKDPYYKTTVFVSNPLGVSIDFGGKYAIIDGEEKNGLAKLSYGKHSIWVHKNNWKAIDSSTVTDLTTLKAADSFYPYNHRYVVEGFNYPAEYPTTEEKLYKGFDIVAEYSMKEVSIFDFIKNVAKDGYDKFALDLDMEDTGRLFDGSPASITSPTTVFVVKVDEENPDFMNEKFMIRFKSINLLFKYLRFKAVFTTQDSNKTPFLDSYRIKLSS